MSRAVENLPRIRQAGSIGEARVPHAEGSGLGRHGGCKGRFRAGEVLGDRRRHVVRRLHRQRLRRVHDADRRPRLEPQLRGYLRGGILADPAIRCRATACRSRPSRTADRASSSWSAMRDSAARPPHPRRACGRFGSRAPGSRHRGSPARRGRRRAPRCGRRAAIRPKSARSTGTRRASGPEGPPAPASTCRTSRTGGSGLGSRGEPRCGFNELGVPGLACQISGHPFRLA
jgi:hypothetical protein